MVVFGLMKGSATQSPTSTLLTLPLTQFFRYPNRQFDRLLRQLCEAPAGSGCQGYTSLFKGCPCRRELYQITPLSPSPLFLYHQLLREGKCPLTSPLSIVYPTQAQIKTKIDSTWRHGDLERQTVCKTPIQYIDKNNEGECITTTMEPSVEFLMALLPPQAFAGILKSSISSPKSVRGQLSRLKILVERTPKENINIVVATILTSNIFGQETCLSLIPEWLLKRIFGYDLSGNATAATVIFTDFPIMNWGLFREIRAGNLAKNDLTFNRRSPDLPKGGPGHEILVSCVGLCRSPGRPTISDRGFRRQNIPNWISDDLRLSDGRAGQHERYDCELDRKMDIRNGGMIGKIMEE
ncbi:hypothetical protein I7I51_02693 [Histoplasma capsulatum]|uniref:Uncharacterized protein n=1 Tax=Ajellomyces capsulatus TaxID=5037 RepID=A0A8A1MJ45_AJECA|nr:hypothetical protein I7I51_02693 [Histoplasma capsulatum]